MYVPFMLLLCGQSGNKSSPRSRGNHRTAIKRRLSYFTIHVPNTTIYDIIIMLICTNWMALHIDR